MSKLFQEPVLFFDIDGTLVDPQTGKVPQSTFEAISFWQQKGYLCCLASGRSYATSRWTNIKDHKFDGFVGVNGQQIIDKDGKVIREIYLPEDLIIKTIEVAKRLNHNLLFIEENGWSRIGEIDDNLIEVIKFLNAPMPNIKDYHGQKVLYIMAIAPKGYDYKEYEDLGYHCAKAYLPYADLVLKGISKAEGIKIYLDYLGLKRYYGFGDSMNDYEMLVGADKAIVMKQGDKHLLEIADYIAGPFEEDGLAKTLYQLWEEEKND